MTTQAMLAVLLGAVLHASWNALIKGSRDKFLDTVLVASGAALIALVLLPFTALPAAASWPHIALSVCIHVIYYSLVAAAYRTGDMSHAYPLMRGTAPLLVAMFSGLILGEVLVPLAWIGVVLICGSILGLTLLRSKNGQNGLTSTLFALGNAVIIAAYTFNDGVGVRLSGNAIAYNLWLFILTVIPLLIIVTRSGTARLADALRQRWAIALGGGFCTFGSYALALWAMMNAPIATVSALRETSILFGMLIAGMLLGERIGPLRIVAGCGIVAGIAALKLSG
jgi:drug/metabolite transporter (DMT)-like permease